MNTQPLTARNAPMPAAPIRYAADGSVQWDAMWDNFCELAQSGGPPHRGSLLRAPAAASVDSHAYRQVVAELTRAIKLVSGLNSAAAGAGWLAIRCDSDAQAQWLSEAIMAENVEAGFSGQQLFVPCGENFALTGEIKNVVTAVAKTTHYWQDHLARELKGVLWMEQCIARVRARLGRRTAY